MEVNTVSTEYFDNCDECGSVMDSSCMLEITEIN